MQNQIEYFTTSSYNSDDFSSVIEIQGHYRSSVDRIMIIAMVRYSLPQQNAEALKSKPQYNFDHEHVNVERSQKKILPTLIEQTEDNF